MSDGRFVTFRHLGHYGRLGNQLFQVAATIGIARRNGCDAVFPLWPAAKHFAGHLPQASAIAPAEIYVESTFAYQDIAIAGPTELVGHFQSEKYFKHCEAEIRRLFRPAPALREHVTRYARSYVGPVSRRRTCSVHVRRGDYVNNPYFTDLSASDYYERAFARLPPDTAFLVFSDDIAWCRQRFGGQNFLFIEGQGPIVDLVMMALCGSHIIANSSFSWWSAWLDPHPEKTVIAPAEWFAGSLADPSIRYVPGLVPDGYFDTRDLLPESWSVL